MKICFKMEDILYFNLPWNFQRIETCFVNIIWKQKNQFSSLVFSETCSSYNYGVLKKQRYFAELLNVFAIASVKSPWHDFSSIHFKRKIWTRILIKQTVTMPWYSWSHNWMALERCFWFHWNCKRSWVEVRSSMSIVRFISHFSYFEISHTILTMFS